MANERGINGKAMGEIGNTYGAPTFLFTATAVAGTSSYTLVDAAAHKLRVVDAWFVMTGAGESSDTVKLTTGGNDITDTVDLSSAGDTDVVRVGEIDDAYHDIAKGADLSATTASDATCIIYVLCTRA